MKAHHPSASLVRANSTSHGFTLIELVVAITVVAIAITGILGLLSSVSLHSADTLVREQAAAIAASYLDEALLKSFDDPDGVDGELARAALDDVDDYNGLADAGARDQLGVVVNGLGQFQISIAVGAGVLGGIPAADVKRVDVRVQHVSGPPVLLTGYRTRY